MADVDIRQGWREIQALKAGHAYVLYVAADTDSDERTSERAVTMSRDIELQLSTNNPFVEVDVRPCIVRHNDAQQFAYEFWVRALPDYPGDSVEFELGWQRVGFPGRTIRCSGLSLRGNGRPPGSPFPIRMLQLDRRVGEEVRVLYVIPRTSSMLYVQCVWDQEVEIEADIVKPAVSPARYMRDREGPRDIIDRIKEKSADIDPAFERWLKDNLGKYGSDFCLIIHDSSSESDMAWELLFVNVAPNERLSAEPDLWGEVPIGALCSIVRWIPGLHWHGTYLTPNESHSIKGDVVAYLDAGVARSGVEQQMLDGFRSEMHDSLLSLSQRAISSFTRTALVYLGCHGTPVNDEREYNFILGSLSPQDQITVYNFASLPFLDPAGPRPFVIVNACYSAWTFEQEESRYGVPIALLRRVAREFIGTIGPIDTDSAARIARRLLQDAGSSDEGIRPAAILRKMRSEAVHRSRQSSNGLSDEWFDYLYTYMYVYYGNPYTRLCLRSAGEGGTEVVQ